MINMVIMVMMMVMVMIMISTPFVTGRYGSWTDHGILCSGVEGTSKARP